MTRPFDMALFLSGVLIGSKATQQRHLRQAQVMQTAIQQRWQRDNPWTWQLKHMRWFLTQHLKDHSDASRYYYRLTALLVWKRLGNGRELPIGRSTSRGWAALQPHLSPVIHLSADILLLNEPIRSTPAQRQKSADSVEKVGFSTPLNSGTTTTGEPIRSLLG